MEIKQLFEGRLVDIVTDPSFLGNVAFAEDDNGLHLIWDIPFNTGVEASMFQRLFLSVIASLYYELSGYSSRVSGEKIIIDKPEEGHILLAQSKIYSFGNHFKGYVIMSKDELVDKKTFCSKMGEIFTLTLEELNTTNLKIRNY